jgi:hypothetical protein
MAERTSNNHRFGGLFTFIAAGIATLTLVGLLIVTGCNVLPGKISGDKTANQAPVVDFTNVPAERDTFSYAPVIHWKGRDSDGFVEEYIYADIIDSTAISAPDYYIGFIPAEAWIRTQALSDTVYLLTEAGQVTQHVFYLKCVDDRGAESAVTYRTFFRSNHAPNVPLLKYFPAHDTTFATDGIVPDTLYCLDRVTDTWGGIVFTWKGTDPDDRDLYRIPLTYRYFLEKVPHDTVWQWVSSDWITKQDVTIGALETGHYTLSVWSRDDGLEKSSRPAKISFDVYKPSFEQSILLFNTTRENLPLNPGRMDIVPGNQVGELYKQLCSRYQDVEYLHYPNPDSIRLYKSFIGRFRLVVWFGENHKDNLAPFQGVVRDYVRIGGRLWVLGNYVMRNVIPRNAITLADTILSLANNSRFAGPAAGAWFDQNNQAEFNSAISGVKDLPSLVIDTSKTGEVNRLFWTRYKTYPCLPGVDIMTTGSGVETCYYFNSQTDTANGVVPNDTASVKVNIDTLYYPPTPVDCLIKIDTMRVLSVSRVENMTRGVRGEVESLTNNVGIKQETVLRVSYPYGEPWSVTDVIQVDYVFQPYSNLHLRPCGIRYERLSIGDQGNAYEVRYRVAIFTFPLYFLDNRDGKVTEMFDSMLEWFFQAWAH